MIAWFGTGLMGAAFVERLRERGDDVVVYNRTFEKALELERFGAKAMRDAGEAAATADLLDIMLSDDAAVDALLEQIAPHVRTGAVVIDHSTVSPAATARRSRTLGERGIAFLHAPVLMSPPMVRKGQGVMLVCGPRATFDAAAGHLGALAPDVWYLGEEPDKAAGMKLFGNEMLIGTIAAVADGFALARGAGIDAAEAFELFSHFKLQGGIEFRGKKIAEQDFESFFGLTMARKDVGLMLETARDAGLTLHMLPAIAARMDRLIEEGRGNDDFSVLGKADA